MNLREVTFEILCGKFENTNQYIQMNGREVFKFATRAMEEALLNICDTANIEICE